MAATDDRARKRPNSVWLTERRPAQTQGGAAGRTRPRQDHRGDGPAAGRRGPGEVLDAPARRRAGRHRDVRLLVRRHQGRPAGTGPGRGRRRDGPARRVGRRRRTGATSCAHSPSATATCWCGHPWVSPLLGEFINIGPHSMAFSNATQRVMRRSGLPADQASGALSVRLPVRLRLRHDRGPPTRPAAAPPGMSHDDYFQQVDRRALGPAGVRRDAGAVHPGRRGPPGRQGGGDAGPGLRVRPRSRRSRGSRRCGTGRRADATTAPGREARGRRPSAGVCRGAQPIGRLSPCTAWMSSSTFSVVPIAAMPAATTWL